MNILLLTASFLPVIGGRELVVHNLATALQKNGHNVYVLSPFRNGPRYAGVQEYNALTFGFRGSQRLKLTLPLAIGSLAWVCQRFKIDVVNAHSVYLPGTWAYHFKRIFRQTIAIVGTPHGVDIQVHPDLHYGVRLDPAADRVVCRNVKDFNLVTAISPSVRKHLDDILGSSEKIRDIPNGVWTGSFQDGVVRSVIRETYGIPQDSVALISVGRNHPKKGFKLGVEALAKLVGEGKRISYVLVGRDMDANIQAARDLGVPSSLVTPGELGSEELAKLYQACDIYVSPSYVESFGLTTIEAMSAGLPCVVSKVEGNTDLVSSEWGELVEAGNSGELAHAIRQLIENPRELSAKGARARVEARRYDWPSIAGTYVNIYAEAMAEMRRSILGG